jgi:hypothetical protein
MSRFHPFATARRIRLNGSSRPVRAIFGPRPWIVGPARERTFVPDLGTCQPLAHGEARGGAQFPELGPLLLGDVQGFVVQFLGGPGMPLLRLQVIDFRLAAATVLRACSRWRYPPAGATACCREPKNNGCLVLRFDGRRRKISSIGSLGGSDPLTSGQKTERLLRLIRQSDERTLISALLSSAHVLVPG